MIFKLFFRALEKGGAKASNATEILNCVHVIEIKILSGTTTSKGQIHQYS